MNLKTFHHTHIALDRLINDRTESVAVCLPAREVAATVGPIVRSLVTLREQGAVDSVVLIDADSADGTAAIASAEGASVIQEGELLPEFGAVRGKGDAMWRALSVVSEDLICFLDADSAEFSNYFATGLIAPLLFDEVVFAKAFYRRPFRSGDVQLSSGGGRVTELTAKPLLRRFYPELAQFGQPLSGEFAARRDVLISVPFMTDYAVETALLIDVYKKYGLESMAQVDLEQRLNAHQSLEDLGPMADSVLAAVVERLVSDGRLTGAPDTLDLMTRPPMSTVR